MIRTPAGICFASTIFVRRSPPSAGCIFAALIEEFHLQPILAVVPDNRDPELEVSPPDPSLLGADARPRVRRRSDRPARLPPSLCEPGRSLLGLHRIRSLPASPQRRSARGFEWACIFCAAKDSIPESGLLRAMALTRTRSRRFARRESLCSPMALRACRFVRDGLTWIPQQLWAPVEKHERPLDHLRPPKHHQ